MRHAIGDERYLAFSGETEQPYPGEVILADDAGNARRWCHRQSTQSAVSSTTSAALIVAEAMHESAAADAASLIGTLDAELRAAHGRAGCSAHIR